MTRGSLRARFWGKVAIGEPHECWLWTAAKDAKGYGHIKVGGRNLKSHRVAVWLSTGIKPAASALVCHRCNTSGCVNPAHLYVGTASDNQRDRVRSPNYRPPTQPSAAARPRGERHYRAKLTEANVLEIRASSESSNELARRFGVSGATIRWTRSGKGWPILSEATDDVFGVDFDDDAKDCGHCSETLEADGSCSLCGGARRAAA